MSYCRLGSTSDVHLYPDIEGNYVCCVCKLTNLEHHTVEFPWESEPFHSYCHSDTVLPDARSALAHMNNHKVADHRVPPYVIERLESEIEGENI